MTATDLPAMLAMTLLHSLWQDALIGLLAAASLALLDRRSAALRHALGMTFLVAMALVPLLTFLAMVGGQPDAGAALPIPGSGTPVLITIRTLPGAPGVMAPDWLGWLWAAGVALMLVRLAGGWSMLGRLDRAPSDPLPHAWHLRAEALRHRLGIRRAVAIRLLRGAGLPCSARALRPVIWLPVSILTRLTADQIEALIAHELAHIRRLDWVWNGVQCAIEALLFYHPALWWLSRQIRAERENACDDLAVAACGDAIVLAEALHSLEGLRTPASPFALSAKGSPLMNRITRLLTPQGRTRLRWGVPLGLVVLLGAGAGLAVTAAPATRGLAGTTVQMPHWWEAFGDSTEIHRRVGSERRVYRQWYDLKGGMHESYSVNDRPVAIDAGVRLWVKQAHRVPAPPMPPIPPMPPMPRIEESAAYKAVGQRILNDPHLVAALGAPVTLRGVHGPSYLDDDTARLSIALSGSKGTAQLHVVGSLDGGIWRFSALDVAPDNGTPFALAGS